MATRREPRAAAWTDLGSGCTGRLCYSWGVTTALTRPALSGTLSPADATAVGLGVSGNVAEWGFCNV